MGAQPPGVAATDDIDISFRFAGDVAGPRGNVGQFRRNLGEILAATGAGFQRQELIGLPIDRRHPATRIKADDAGAHAKKHRLGEQAPRLGFDVGGAQVLLLLLKIDRHAVEGARQDRDLLWVAPRIHPRGQVACRNLPGRPHQARHRLGDPSGGGHAKPDRANQHQKHGFEIAQIERRFDSRPPGLGLSIGRQRVGCFMQMPENSVA